MQLNTPKTKTAAGKSAQKTAELTFNHLAGGGAEIAKVAASCGPAKPHFFDLKGK